MLYLSKQSSYEKTIYLNNGYLNIFKPLYVLYLPNIQSYPIWTIIEYDNIVFDYNDISISNSNIEFVFQFYNRYNNVISNYENFFKELSYILSINKNYEINLFNFDKNEKLKSINKIKIKNYSLNYDNPQKIYSDYTGYPVIFKKNIYLNIVPKIIKSKFYN